MFGSYWRLRLAAAYLTLALASPLAGCNADNQIDPSPPGPPSPAALIVTVEPALVSLTAGETRQLRGQVRTPSGIFLPSALLWSSGDESIASVSGTGLVTAHRAGETAIMAKVAAGQGLGRAVVTVR